jgi:lipopolysaccharide export system protein LptA
MTIAGLRRTRAAAPGVALRPAPDRRSGRTLRLAASLALGAALSVPLLAMAVDAAAAQQEKKQASPFQGFSSDNGKPVDVNSDSLEVYQNEQKAIFVGNVVAVQGDSTLKTPRLIVFYENTSAGAAGTAGAAGAAGADAGAATSDTAKPASAPTKSQATAPSSASSIKRLEATGGVTVTSQDQKATGDNGVFDMATNTAVLTGNVVMTQGANVIRGKELHVDLKTGLARVVGGTNAIFIQDKSNQPNGQQKAK